MTIQRANGETIIRMSDKVSEDCLQRIMNYIKFNELFEANTASQESEATYRQATLGANDMLF